MIAVLYNTPETKFDMRARILNRELVEWHLASVKELQIERVIVITNAHENHREREALQSFVRTAAEYWNVAVHFADEARDIPPEHTLLLQQTHLYTGDLTPILRAHRENSNTLTIGARDTDRYSPDGYASVVGRVAPPMIVSPAVDWRQLSPGNWGADALQDLARCVDGGKTQLVHADAYWHPLHHGIDLYHVNQEALLENRSALRESEIAPGIFVGCDTRIHPQAELEGPLLIGDRCFIGPGVRLGPGAIIESDAYLCGGATVKRSLIGNRTYVRSGTVLEDVLLFNGSLGRGNRIGGPGIASAPAIPLPVDANDRR